MSRMKIVIHCVTFFIGAWLVWQGGVGHTRPIAVWSDFRAFSARVAEDEATRHALRYGGEEEGTDFEYLLDRVWSLSEDWTKVLLTGFLLCAVSTGGIVIEIVKKRRTRTIEPEN